MAGTVKVTEETARQGAAGQGAAGTALPGLDAIAEEAFRTLRTNLLMRLAEGDRSVLVTSARPREGKTTVAANLAVALASTGHRIALVDGDLRRPRLHTLLRLDNTVGFSDVLRGSVRACNACVEVQEGLKVMPSGRLPRDPQELLGSAAVNEALTDLRGEFDLVIVDAAPLLAVADAVLLAPKVDGVLLVFHYRGVSESEARSSRDRLRAVGARIVGAVFNGFEGESMESYHPYVAHYSNGRGR